MPTISQQFGLLGSTKEDKGLAGQKGNVAGLQEADLEAYLRNERENILTGLIQESFDNVGSAVPHRFQAATKLF